MRCYTTSRVRVRLLACVSALGASVCDVRPGPAVVGGPNITSHSRPAGEVRCSESMPSIIGADSVKSSLQKAGTELD